MVSGTMLNPDMRAGQVVSFFWTENLGAREGTGGVLATPGIFLPILLWWLFLKRPLPPTPP